MSEVCDAIKNNSYMTGGATEKNILLTIAYDGTGFCGWQRQPGSRTVCGELEEVLSSLLRRPVKLNGTSRTDAGVHALGQRASFRAACPIPTERLAKVINDRLAGDRLEGVGDLRVLEAREMPGDFHARFSSKGKRYIYRIYESPERDIFRRNYFYQVSGPLDIEAMREAAAFIKGEHDFACFQSSGSTPQESTVRTVYRLDVERLAIDGGPAGSGLSEVCMSGSSPEAPTAGGASEIRITVEGNAFLYNMVRIIAGTLTEAGQGRRTPDSVRLAIEGRDRSKAGHTAPPQGLYLAEVFYDRGPEGPAGPLRIRKERFSMEDKRPGWDEYFMEMAELARKRSSCLRRGVGAVIVKDNHMLASGYNGAPAGVAHCSETGCLREQLHVPSGQRHELCRGLHAEQNAIIQAAKMGVNIDGATLYCTTQPCIICTKMIINAGIKRVVIKESYPDELAQKMAEEAGLKIELLGEKA